MSEPALPPCALRGCGGATKLSYRLSRFDVRRCRRCGILFRDPLPDDDELRRMYEDPAYHAGAYFDEAADPLRPEAEMQEDALDALESIRSECCSARGTRPARLLDVGCGSGGFLRRASTRGWSCAGVEFSRALSVRCERETGVTPVCSDFLDANFEARSFDVVTMWDFIEHVRDPAAVLEKAAQLIAPEGRLLVFTIDSASLFNTIGRLLYRASFGHARFAAELLYDARHNFYFDQATLAATLGAAGFRTESTSRYRAHLGRWLAEPASLPVRLAGDAIDAASVLLGRQYRQLLICRREPS